MRTARQADGKAVREETLDPNVCTCCPTSVVKTGRGLLVAYRGNTAESIRDIDVIKFENGKWTPSKNIYPDKWKTTNAMPDQRRRRRGERRQRCHLVVHLAAGSNPRGWNSRFRRMRVWIHGASPWL